MRDSHRGASQPCRVRRVSPRESSAPRTAAPSHGHAHRDAGTDCTLLPAAAPSLHVTPHVSPVRPGTAHALTRQPHQQSLPWSRPTDLPPRYRMDRWNLPSHVARFVTWHDCLYTRLSRIAIGDCGCLNMRRHILIHIHSRNSERVYQKGGPAGSGGVQHAEIKEKGSEKEELEKRRWKAREECTHQTRRTQLSSHDAHTRARSRPSSWRRRSCKVRNILTQVDRTEIGPPRILLGF